MSNRKQKGTDSDSNSSNDDSSSDDSHSDHSTDEIDQRLLLSRKKRGIDWCATNTEDETPSPSSSRAVVWPPQSNSSSASIRNVQWFNSISPQKSWGNPTFDTTMQLFSQTNYFLAINADGTVNGTKDKNDLHTKLKLVNIGAPGRVHILGLLTGQYLALDDRGRLYAHYNVQDENTEWDEIPVGKIYKCYQNVLSKSQLKKRGKGWFLGIKKSGKPKNGRKTKIGQRATKFLSQRKFD